MDKVADGLLKRLKSCAGCAEQESLLCERLPLPAWPENYAGSRRTGKASPVIMRSMKLKIVFIVCIPVLAFGLSLVAGPKMINPFSADDISREILFSIRAPRSLVALLMGMALGASGAVLQGILKIPSQTPISSAYRAGHLLAAALGIMAGAVFLGTFTIPLLAFIGALITEALSASWDGNAEGCGRKDSCLPVLASAFSSLHCSCSS